MIEISSLFSGYSKQNVIEDIDLICDTGKITTIIGPNGCGKSTLLKTIIGILDINKGDIKIDGISVKDMSAKERSQKIAYLSQGKNVPDITVERMVLHGRFCYLSYPRKYRKCDFDAANAAMQEMGITDISKKNLAEISGGMRQKVYIAMALCQGADVIILDEPTTYLDISHQIKIIELTRGLAAKGKTVITVSHDIISALKYSDSIVVMKNGRIIKTGTTVEILKSNIISDIFHVDIATVHSNNDIDYYYRKAVDSN